MFPKALASMILYTSLYNSNCAYSLDTPKSRIPYELNVTCVFLSRRFLATAAAQWMGFFALSVHLRWDQEDVLVLTARLSSDAVTDILVTPRLHVIFEKGGREKTLSDHRWWSDYRFRWEIGQGCIQVLDRGVLECIYANFQWIYCVWIHNPSLVFIAALFVLITWN